MPNRTSFSPMHLYCRNIFQRIHIIFSYSVLQQCFFNAFTPTNANMGSLSSIPLYPLRQTGGFQLMFLVATTDAFVAARCVRLFDGDDVRVESRREEGLLAMMGDGHGHATGEMTSGSMVGFFGFFFKKISTFIISFF
jgi:hypothetical protein